MKTKMAIAVAAGFGISVLLNLGQNDGASGSQTATNSAPAPVAVTNAAVPAPGGEVLPEVHIQDAPVDDVIRFLAAQGELKIEIDPRITSGSPPRVSVNLTNVTAQQALEFVLKQENLLLVPDPNTNIARITPGPSAEPPPIVLPQTNAPPVEIATNVPPVVSVPSAPATNTLTEPVVESLTIAEMPVLDVVTMLADAAKIDIIIDPRLLPGSTNAVSTNAMPAMKFYNKTYRQALDAVLNNNDLVLLTDNKTQIARVTKKPPPEQEPLYTQVVQLRYANVTNMVTLIQTTLPVNTRSKVSADGRTSKLVLLATTRDIEAITNLVSEIDKPSRQVLIETRLIETSINPKSVKGIDWSGTLANQNVSFGNGVTSGQTITTTPGQSSTVTLPSGRTVTRTEALSKRTDLTTLLGNGGFSADTARGFFPETAFLNADGVRAVMSFLNTEADTRILDSPRSVVADNETARLSVTRAFPIFQVTPGAANVPAGAQVTYTNLGTILNVTPRIAADSNVTLRLVPEVSNIESVDHQVLNGQENTANIYAIRKAETIVTVPSGNTLLLGGLASENTSKSYSKVPLLGDIPGIGLLFRRDTKDRQKSSLLIFVTPTIVRSEDFHPTVTDYLKQTPAKDPDVEDVGSAWDRGKPKSWGKQKEK